MDLIDIKNKYESRKTGKVWLYIGIFLFFVIVILDHNVNADYVISAADGNVNIHFDANAGSVPTMNLNIQPFVVDKNFTNYSADFNTPTVNPIILGLEFIMLLFGIMLIFKSVTMFGKKNP